MIDLQTTMQTGPIPRELRVYVASAADEMSGEREHLAEHVFPELRRICHDRGAELAGIDFRRGAPTRGAEPDTLVRLSLDELHLRRPFVLGLVGSRAGWMPSYEMIARDGTLLRRYPWLDRLAEEPRSLLELEIERGVMARPDSPSWSAFYLRSTPDDQLAPEADRLRMLKERIRSGGFRHREDLPDLASFGEWVHGQILTVIDRLFPERRARGFEADLRAMEAFAASRRRGYVPRRSLIDRLERHVASGSEPLVVRGESGVGKSALVAYWGAEHRRRSPEAKLVSHHVGVGGPATRSAVARSLAAQLRHALGAAPELPADEAELLEELPFRLAEAAAAGMILIIDGADQIVDGAGLEWLVPHVPPGLRLIVTTTSRSVLAGRGWPELVVDPLTTGERIALGAGSLFATALPDAAPARADAPITPLLLRARLEELALFGSHERVPRQVERMLATDSVGELIDRKLEMLELEFGREPMASLLGALVCLRDGLSAAELGRLTGSSDVEVAEMLRLLDFYLLPVDGRLRFFHAEMERGVERRYLAAEGEQRAMRRRLVDLFASDTSPARRAEVLPELFEQLGDLDRLRACLADPDILLTLMRGEREYALLRWWLMTGGYEGMEATYREAIESVALTRSVAEVGEMYAAAGDLLRHAGRYAEAEPPLRRAVSAFEELGGEYEPTFASVCYRLSAVLRALGKLDAARDALLRLLPIATRDARAGSLLPEALDNLAGVMQEMGELEEAEAHYRRAIAEAERLEGSGSRLVAMILNNLASMLHRRGAFEEARALYERAIDLFGARLGRRHPETAVATNNLAALRFDLGDRPGAEESYRRVLEIWEETLGPAHPMVGAALNNLASSMAGRGDAGAIPLLERAAAIYGSAGAGEASAELAIVHFTLGRAHYYQDNLEASARAFADALEIQRALFGPEHLDSLATLGWLAKVRRDLGRHARSRSDYLAAISGHERILGAEHLRVGILLGDFGELLEAMNDLRGARSAYARSRSILESILPPDDPRLLAARRRLESVETATQRGSRE